MLEIQVIPVVTLCLVTSSSRVMLWGCLVACGYMRHPAPGNDQKLLEPGFKSHRHAHGSHRWRREGRPAEIAVVHQKSLGLRVSQPDRRTGPRNERVYLVKRPHYRATAEN